MIIAKYSTMTQTEICIVFYEEPKTYIKDVKGSLNFCPKSHARPGG